MRLLISSRALGIVFLLFPLKVFSDIEGCGPHELVDRMNVAMQTLNYHGTVALLRNGKLETMKLTHASHNGIEQERLVSLNSPLRQIVRDSGKVKCFFRESNKLIVDHRPTRRSFFLDMPEQLSALNGFYSFSCGEKEEKIAMRPTKVVYIQPKDDYRYTRKIWIDKESYLPLKFELLDKSEAVLEQSVFIDIEIADELPIVKIEEEEYSDVRHIHQIESMPFEQSEFFLANIPAGFQKVFFTQRQMRGQASPVGHLFLSDGISTVSIYFEKGNQDSISNLITAGAIHSFDRQLDSYRLTVMGEVPARTVRFIADGIQLR
ncbi:MAG: MucB/RseB C-terminal domain-containing protein [Gammaproteobacteria bacterium]